MEGSAEVRRGDPVTAASGRSAAAHDGGRTLASNWESYVPQLSPSARVKPQAPTVRPKPQSGPQVRPSTPILTAENASSPECSAATQQSSPVQTIPFRMR